MYQQPNENSRFGGNLKLILQQEKIKFKLLESRMRVIKNVTNLKYFGGKIILVHNGFL